MDDLADVLTRIRASIRAAAEASDADRKRQIIDDVRNAIEEALDQADPDYWWLQ